MLVRYFKRPSRIEQLRSSTGVMAVHLISPAPTCPEVIAHIEDKKINGESRFYGFRAVYVFD